MTREITITALECECDICHYRWVSIAVKPPECCQSRACRSRQWNGSKRSRMQVIKLPGPRKRGRRRSIALIDINRKGGADGEG